jgi:hypothetical protein
MAQVMKHVGKVGEKPCVVVFREVPDEPEHCLVVKSSGLAPDQHDSLMMVVQSAEAQESNDLANVLHRRQFNDGSNMLASLHHNKQIEKVPVNLVSLTPTPATAIPLADVNAEIRKINNNSNPPSKTEVNPAVYDKPVQQAPLTESVTEAPVMPDPVAETAITGDQDPAAIAQQLLLQAGVIEDDAKALLKDAEAKKQEAYRLNPELQPKKGPGRPKKAATA